MQMLSILVISRSKERMSILLKSIAESSYAGEIEIIVAWNGRDEPEFEPSVESKISVFYYQIMPYNFSENNNRLAKYARGEVLLFLNDDIILDTGCLKAATEEIARAEVGIVGAKLRYPDGLVQHAGVFFRVDGTPFHRHKHEIPADNACVGTDEFVPAVTGAFLMIRRSEFLALKFDERFSVAGEDVCLCLKYRHQFKRGILYCSDATAVHYENATRRETDERDTPAQDRALISEYTKLEVEGVPITRVKRPKVRIVTEKEGWIMHRKAKEIQLGMGEDVVRINQDWDQADIHYYINYGYFNKRPAKGKLVLNFTHYDPDSLADKFVESALVADHCTSVSALTSLKLFELGVPEEKVTTIRVGADSAFKPKLVFGIPGRPYKGGRKGEDLLQALLDDPAIMQHCKFVSRNAEWGVPVIGVEDNADFYRCLDYLLITSRIEGGPVSFMEALACGTLSVAPPIGVVPEFPHVSYDTGSIDSLKATILDLIEQMKSSRGELAKDIARMNWAGWSIRHEKLFRSLLLDRALS